jgi:hypothetical protein
VTIGLRETCKIHKLPFYGKLLLLALFVKPKRFTIECHTSSGRWKSTQHFLRAFCPPNGFHGGMTIWVLALVLLASLAALGYRQGAIRVGFSFAGIVIAALLAAPLGKCLKPLMLHIGIHNPTFIWMLAPLEAFVLVLILFKIAGAAVHRRTELHYRYNRYDADNLQFVLWERLIRRLGLCLGVLNGTAYFVLLCFVLFNFSYWTVQITPSDAETRTVRLINLLGRDLEGTGMDKAARAVATLPADYYKLADLAGLLRQNPQLSGLLARYPAFLSLAECNEFQQLAQDSAFTNAWQARAPIGQLLSAPQVKAILQNNGFVNIVWENLQTNIDDLMTYLKTGQSPKYDSQRILGYWGFNTATTAAMLPIAQPKISPAEIRFARLWMTNYAQTTLIFSPDHQVFLHNLPHLTARGSGDTATLHLWPVIVHVLRSGSLPDMGIATLTGQWEYADGSCKLIFDSNGMPDAFNVLLKDSRLTVTTADGDSLIFDREE